MGYIKLPCRVVISNANCHCADTLPPALDQAGEETGGDQSSMWPDEAAEGIGARPGEIDCPLLCFRLVRRHEETKAQRGQMKQLKGLMHGLVNITGDPEKQQLDAIRNARQLAFLITDLQDSTAMASANPVAFRKVQDIHDTVSSLLRNVQDIHDTVL